VIQKYYRKLDPKALKEHSLISTHLSFPSLLFSPSTSYSLTKLINSNQCLNLDLSSDLVNTFIGLSFEASFSTTISLDSIKSQTK